MNASAIPKFLFNKIQFLQKQKNTRRNRVSILYRTSYKKTRQLSDTQFQFGYFLMLYIFYDLLLKNQFAANQLATSVNAASIPSGCFPTGLCHIWTSAATAADFRCDVLDQISSFQAFLICLWRHCSQQINFAIVGCSKELKHPIILFCFHWSCQLA